MTWGTALLARLRAARLNPPTTDNVVDLVEAAARRGVARSRQRTGRVAVSSRSNKIVVQSSGAVRPYVVDEVNRARPAIEARLRQEAARKVRGH